MSGNVRRSNTRKTSSSRRRDASLDTDNTSVCIHPVIDAKGADGRGLTRYCNTARFYGKPGGVVEPSEGGEDGGGEQN